MLPNPLQPRLLHKPKLVIISSVYESLLCGLYHTSLIKRFLCLWVGWPCNVLGITCKNTQVACTRIEGLRLKPNQLDIYHDGTAYTPCFSCNTPRGRDTVTPFGKLSRTLLTVGVPPRVMIRTISTSNSCLENGNLLLGDIFQVG